MPHPAKRRLASFAALLTALLIAAVAPSPASGALSTRDLSGSGGPLTAAELAQALAGPGVTVSNVTYTGAPSAGGTFAGGGGGIIGFDEGVVLGSGRVGDIVGPNREDGKTTAYGTPGDGDLDALVGAGSTLDAAVLAFDFVPSVSTLTFNYVFASDEYNEFVSEGVSSGVNDVFAFFVNGQNCAFVPGTGNPVSINTINNGNPFGNTNPEAGVVAKQPQLYRNNDVSDGGGSIDTEMDGLTTVLQCAAGVAPGQVNRVKLAIADRSDSSLDSNVFLQRGSFVSVNPPPAYPPPAYPPPDDDGDADADADGVPDARDACPAVPADTLNGCPLPPPVVGRMVNIEPLSGEVFVSVPPAASAARWLIARPLAGAAVPGLERRTFVPLREARQVPVGSLLDTRRGTVRITSAQDRAGKTQSGDFAAGVFQVLQSRKAKAKGLTELRLKGANFGSCAKRARPGSARAEASRRRTIRRLRSNAKGRFRTRGRHAAATVRGTDWTTTDRCDGTLTKVTRGKVAVRDFRRKKTIIVRAGKSYLAKAKR